MKPKILLILIAWSCYAVTNAQTLYVPSGTSGIGTSTTTNVGIGNSLPLLPLSVGNYFFGLQGGNASPYAGYLRFGDNTGWKFIIGRSREQDGGPINTNNTGALLTVEDKGNVGIGTTTPTSKLNIDPNGAGGILIGNSNTSSGSYTSLSLMISDAQNGYGYLQTIKASGSSYGNLVFNPKGGNVLIGKTRQTNSSYLLDVAGKIRANEVVVNTNGADFVFNPSYKLRSLSSLESYVQQHKHLPGIASAKEMKANGVDMGTLQTKLLQKVEELTLYTIAQDKKLKEQDMLKVKVEEQAKVNEELKAEAKNQSKVNDELKQQLADQANEIAQLKQLITQKLK